MQASPRWPPEGLGLRRWTIGALACAAAVVAGANIAQQPYLIFAAALGLIYVGTLAVNAPVLAWLIIALQPAALIVPFFPGRPFFWELCAMLAWPSLAAYYLMNREKIADNRLDRNERRALLGLVGYVGVILFLMVYRGVGFRIFGGEQMGGRTYAQQIVLAILPMLLLTVQLSRRGMQSAVVTGWLLSTTYFIAEMWFSAGGGVMQKVLYFFELPTDGLNFEFSYSATGIRRYGSFAAVAIAGLYWLWSSAPLKVLLGRRLWVAGPIMIGLMALGCGSGYRSMLIAPIMTFGFLTLFQRFWSPRRILVAVIAVVSVVGILYQVADEMPLPVQRSVSFLPDIQVSPLARADAATTNMDRLEVIKLALSDLPKYWVAGRGFGMERLDQLPDDASGSVVYRLYIQGLFYNGIVGSFVKTGIPGLIFTLVFVWYASRMALDLVALIRRRSESDRTPFDSFCLLIAAWWFSMVVFFYFTNGDINLWMQHICLPAALVMACRRLQLQQSADKAEPATAEVGRALV